MSSVEVQTDDDYWVCVWVGFFVGWVFCFLFKIIVSNDKYSGPHPVTFRYLWYPGSVRPPISTQSPDLTLNPTLVSHLSCRKRMSSVELKKEIEDLNSKNGSSQKTVDAYTCTDAVISYDDTSLANGLPVGIGCLLKDTGSAVYESSTDIGDRVQYRGSEILPEQSLKNLYPFLPTQISRDCQGFVNASSGAPLSLVLNNVTDMTGDFREEDVVVIAAGANDLTVSLREKITRLWFFLDNCYDSSIKFRTLTSSLSLCSTTITSIGMIIRTEKISEGSCSQNMDSISTVWARLPTEDKRGDGRNSSDNTKYYNHHATTRYLRGGGKKPLRDLTLTYWPREMLQLRVLNIACIRKFDLVCELAYLGDCGVENCN
ncbi:hypothetical protein J6590_099834 [Homalodisca vitripennis]|nr:hypothetical protein J6590_099834 [Homalodisca vitripennis]